jgi:hypothetical protein
MNSTRRACVAALFGTEVHPPPNSAPTTVAASAGPVPATHAVAMIAVLKRRNKLPWSTSEPNAQSMTNTTATAPTAAENRRGVESVNG